MHGTRSPALAALLSALLLAPLVAPALLPHPRARRQLADDDTLQPLEDASGAEQAREKRKLEGVTEAKFGIKNAVLGFVFGKINSLIDAKTRFVESLDQKNIELNKQYGIEAPSSGGLASLSGIVGQVIGPKLQLLGPKIQAVSGLLGGASGGGGSSGGSEEDGASARSVCDGGSRPQTGRTWRGPAVSRTTRQAEPRTTHQAAPAESRTTRQEAPAEPRTSRQAAPSPPRTMRQAAAPKDDIPEFDRNKVSLDFPGSLFGPSVSLLIRTTKIIGDVIQNSAVRYQSFLRLFRPLFKGQFEIKGLDPPTTTTTTTTTRAPASDNEVRRR